MTQQLRPQRRDRDRGLFDENQMQGCDKGLGGELPSCSVLRLLTTHTRQLEILVKTPGNGIFL